MRTLHKLKWKFLITTKSTKIMARRMLVRRYEGPQHWLVNKKLYGSQYLYILTYHFTCILRGSSVSWFFGQVYNGKRERIYNFSHVGLLENWRPFLDLFKILLPVRLNGEHIGFLIFNQRFKEILESSKFFQF
jgi:hypothetical protein